MATLSRLPVLWCLGIATLVLHAAIHWAKRFTGGQLLDLRWTADGARSLLAGMATIPGAVDAHIWITGALDTAYPMAYGGLVAGLCVRYSTVRPAVAAAPAILAAACDLAENAIQLLALHGHADLLPAKTLLTPAKFALITAASAWAIGLWVTAMVRPAAR
ncbi:MAG: hypothetical protein AAF253_07025 [Pseudomonadota bacterium]